MAKKHFAARLKALIAAAGVSVADLAEKAGLYRDTIYKLLAGEREPSFDTACKLADALGLKLEAFR
jgi:gp16 family phage-associated protein